MKSKSGIFREKSLERLSSPEQLDQLLQITTPKGWVALISIGIIIAVAVLWSLFGIVPRKVRGEGVLIRTGGVTKVVAPSSGRVIDIAVRAGDSVEAGQVVARLEKPVIAENLDKARAKLRILKQEYDQIQMFLRRDTVLSRSVLESKRERLKKKIEANEKEAKWLAEKLTSRKNLLESGLITEQQVIETRQKLQQLRQSIQATETELQRINVRLLELRNENRKKIRELRLDIEEQKRRIARLEDKMDRRSQLRSNYQGRVLEITVGRGDIVSAGESVLNMSRTGRDVKSLEAVIYVSARDGKRVEEGMTVQISPASVEAQKHGRMLGVVNSVSDFPATPKGMNQLLGNKSLVEAMTKGGNPYEVHADLLLNPSTPTQYRWTSSRGPDIKLQSGTLCRGTVTVKEQRPISMVLPIFREYTGTN